MKAIIDFSQFKSLTSGSTKFSESALKLIFDYYEENDLFWDLDVARLRYGWMECRTIEDAYLNYYSGPKTTSEMLRYLEDKTTVLIGDITIVMLLF
jgi:hypothetical protein